MSEVTISVFLIRESPTWLCWAKPKLRRREYRCKLLLDRDQIGAFQLALGAGTQGPYHSFIVTKTKKEFAAAIARVRETARLVTLSRNVSEPSSPIEADFDRVELLPLHT